MYRHTHTRKTQRMTRSPVSKKFVVFYVFSFYVFLIFFCSNSFTELLSFAESMANMNDMRFDLK